MSNLTVRNRAERLFGFFYRIEVFVPEAKRQYGYYVFPVLEGARLIGRLRDGRFTLPMDQGGSIEVAVTLDHQARSARIDFTGTTCPGVTRNRLRTSDGFPKLGSYYAMKFTAEAEP